jgi:hypothetical protein
MPVFYYFTTQEVADVYLYLSSYPPSSLNAELAPLAATTQQNGGANSSPLSVYSSPQSPSVLASSNDQQRRPTVASWAAALVLLAIAGFGMSLFLLVCCMFSYQFSQPRHSAVYRSKLGVAITSKAGSAASDVAGANCRRT